VIQPLSKKLFGGFTSAGMRSVCEAQLVYSAAEFQVRETMPLTETRLQKNLASARGQILRYRNFFRPLPTEEQRRGTVSPV
jgi:hypothetical protein